MREATTLPHEKQFVGVLWNQLLKKGNYDTWGRKPVTKIVMHTMDGFTEGSTSWFKQVNQSAHYGISYDGKKTLWIPENCVAYSSSFYPLNQESINIEHEDMRRPNDPRPDTLYESSAELLADIARFYNFPLNRNTVILHRNVVMENGKTVFQNSGKTCPAMLDVDRIIKRANELLAPPASTVTMVEVQNDVFIQLVKKSTEYDNIWTAFGMPPDLKEHVGSHKLIVDKVNQKLSEAKIASGTPTPTVVPSLETPVIPVKQPKTVWNKGIGEMLKEMFTVWKKEK